MENEQLVKVESLPTEAQEAIKVSGLDHTKAQVYIAAFFPHMNALSELEQKINSIPVENPTKEDASLARTLRLQYVKNRTASDKLKTELKKNLLTETGLIQAMYNVIEKASSMKETHLEAIEKHQENIEKAAKEKLKAEREAILKEYVENPAMYPLGEIDKEAFDQLVEGMKAGKEKKEQEAKKAELKTDREATLIKYMDIPVGYSLGDLQQEAFDILLEQAKNAFEEAAAKKLEEEEALRKQNEELLLAEQTRTKLKEERANILFEYDENAWLLDLGTMEQEAFDKLLEETKAKKQAARQLELKAEQEAQEKQRVKEERITAMLPYKFKDATGVTGESFVADMKPEEFEAHLQGVKEAWEQKIEADKQAQLIADMEKQRKESRGKIIASYGIELSLMEWDRVFKMTEEGFSNYTNILQKGKEKQEADLRAEQESAKGDKQKMQGLIIGIMTLSGQIEFKSKKYKAAHEMLDKELLSLKDKINASLTTKAK